MVRPLSSRFLVSLPTNGLLIGKCLTVAGNYDGARVTLNTCTGAANQKWVFPGDNTVRVYGGKCLDVIDGVNQDGTKLQVWGCGPNPNANKKFSYNKWDNTLTWVGKGKCMDVTDGQSTDGTPVRFLITMQEGVELTPTDDRSKSGVAGTRTLTRSGVLDIFPLRSPTNLRTASTVPTSAEQPTLRARTAKPLGSSGSSVQLNLSDY